MRNRTLVEENAKALREGEKNFRRARAKISPEKKAGIGMFSGAMVSVAVGGAVLGLTLGHLLPLGLPMEAGFATAGFFALLALGLAIGAGVSLGANQRVGSQDQAKGEMPKHSKDKGADKRSKLDAKKSKDHLLDPELAKNKPEAQYESKRRTLKGKDLIQNNKRKRSDRSRGRKNTSGPRYTRKSPGQI